jgi:two-component system, LytTR family, response regulator
MKAIIIDDEPLARQLLREYLSAHPDMEVVAECGDGFDGVKAIHHWQPDVVFLDIQMPRMTGFEMLEMLEHPPAIIFATAFDEYAVRAFDSKAVDYLLKPFSRERLQQALQRLRELGIGEARRSTEEFIRERIPADDELQRVVVRNGVQLDIVPTADILYFEAYDDYVKIFTDKTYFLKKETISYFENRLSTVGFVRIHRSFLVQLRSISKLEAYEKGGHVVVLANGKTLPVSRTGYAKLREQLGW